MTRAVRYLVALLVTLGILVPQGAGLLAAAGLADGRVLVICTGDGLRTLHVGADGVPVEISETADFCALVHAVDTADGVLPATAPVRLVFASFSSLPRPGPVGPLAPLAAQPRAPPAV